jgi:hypothetical protein
MSTQLRTESVAFLNEKRESDDVDQTVPAISPSE